MAALMFALGVSSESEEIWQIIMDSSDVPGATLNERLRNFFEGGYFDEIDWLDLIVGIGWNVVENYLIGRLGRGYSARMREMGQSTTTLPQAPI